jgi:ubiquinol-cytochrome c reductase cytochrome b subunit
MMIKLAKHAEANAKLQPKKAAKSAISVSQKWIYVLFVVLLAFQVYLNIAAYYALLQGMQNWSLFIVGIIMLVFAGMFHLYRYGRSLAKAPPPKPTPPAVARPVPAAPKPAPAAPAAERPLAAPPTAASKVEGSEQTPQLPQQQQKSAGGGTADAAGNNPPSSSGGSKSAAMPDHVQQPPTTTTTTTTTTSTIDDRDSKGSKTI